MLFDLRYHSLKNHVDYFVVCEANKTHTGHHKEYNFDKNFLDYINIFNTILGFSLVLLLTFKNSDAKPIT